MANCRWVAYRAPEDDVNVAGVQRPAVGVDSDIGDRPVCHGLVKLLDDVLSFDAPNLHTVDLGSTVERPIGVVAAIAAIRPKGFDIKGAKAVNSSGSD